MSSGSDEYWKRKKQEIRVTRPNKININSMLPLAIDGQQLAILDVFLVPNSIEEQEALEVLTGFILKKLYATVHMAYDEFDKLTEAEQKALRVLGYRTKQELDEEERARWACKDVYLKMPADDETIIGLHQTYLKEEPDMVMESWGNVYDINFKFKYSAYRFSGDMEEEVKQMTAAGYIVIEGPKDDKTT